MDGQSTSRGALVEIERLLRVQRGWSLECFGSSVVSQSGLSVSGGHGGGLAVAHGRFSLRDGEVFVVRCDVDPVPGSDWRIGVATGVMGSKYFVRATGEASDDPLRGQRNIPCLGRPLVANDLVSVRLVVHSSNSDVVAVHFGLNGQWNEQPTFENLPRDGNKFVYLAVDQGGSLTVTLTPWHVLATEK